MPRSQVKLLGTLRASLDGDPVSGFDSDKVRALLAYLVVETEWPHCRETWLDYPLFPGLALRGQTDQNVNPLSLDLSIYKYFTEPYRSECCKL